MPKKLLIFQKSSPGGTERFRQYLSRKKWFRYTRGVYWSQTDSSFDPEAMWQHCKEEFGFNPAQDFFAIVDFSDCFRGGNASFYNKRAPQWPRDDCGDEVN